MHFKVMAQTSLENAARRAATSLKGTKSTPGMTGAKGSRYLSLCVVATEPMVRPWKLCSSARNFVPMLLAFGTQHESVGAGELQRGLPGFGAGVAEEDAVEAGEFGEAQGELGGAAVVEEVAGVQQRLRLRGDGGGDGRVVVAERADADAAEQVEVVVAVLVAQVDAFAGDEHAAGSAS